MTTNTPLDFDCYTIGIIYASVCTSLSDEQAVRRMNDVHFSGLESGWTIADEAFRTGAPNGVACHDRPETHRHILFVC